MNQVIYLSFTNIYERNKNSFRIHSFKNLEINFTFMNAWKWTNKFHSLLNKWRNINRSLLYTSCENILMYEGVKFLRGRRKSVGSVTLRRWISTGFLTTRSLRASSSHVGLTREADSRSGFGRNSIILWIICANINIFYRENFKHEF